MCILCQHGTLCVCVGQASCVRMSESTRVLKPPFLWCIACIMTESHVLPAPNRPWLVMQALLSMVSQEALCTSTTLTPVS